MSTTYEDFQQVLSWTEGFLSYCLDVTCLPAYKQMPIVVSDYNHHTSFITLHY